ILINKLSTFSRVDEVVAKLPWSSTNHTNFKVNRFINTWFLDDRIDEGSTSWWLDSLLGTKLLVVEGNSVVYFVAQLIELIDVMARLLGSETNLLSCIVDLYLCFVDDLFIYYYSKFLGERRSCAKC